MLLAMYIYVLKYYVRTLIAFNEEKCAGYIIDYSLDYIYIQPHWTRHPKVATDFSYYSIFTTNI